MNKFRKISASDIYGYVVGYTVKHEFSSGHFFLKL